MKDHLKFFIIFSLLLLAIPSIVFFRKPSQGGSDPTALQLGFSEGDIIRLSDSSTGEIVEIPLRDYLVGSVLAQIPASFCEETLKAHAVICRTYALRLSPDQSEKTVLRQYFTEEQAREFYGDSYEEAYRKACEAVDSTSGLYIDYGGSPIITAYHAISCGKTESSLNAWGVDVPYLRSVDSPEDEALTGYRQQVSFTPEELSARLFTALGIDFGKELPDESSIKLNTVGDIGTVASVEITANGKVKEISASEFALSLNLNSCNFTVDFSDGEFIMECHGVGHMVGLSQCGAELMAKNGSDYIEILEHYFPGAEVCSLE